MVADPEAVEDGTLHGDRRVDEQGHPGGAEPPVDRRELVDLVPRLLAEETCQLHLVLTQKMQPHALRTQRHAERVIQPRDADEEVGGSMLHWVTKPARQPLISASGDCTVTT